MRIPYFAFHLSLHHRPNDRGGSHARLFLPIGILALIVIAVAISAGLNGGGSSKSRSGPRTRRVLVAQLSHTLPVSISGESVVATKKGPLILGGLDSSSNSASGVFLLDSLSGKLSESGSLTGPPHDSAATLLGERVLVIGGGAETSIDAVQALPAPGGLVAAGTLDLES